METNGGIEQDVPAEVVLLQPVALIDHLCCVDEPTANRLAEGALGGSSRCTAEQLQLLLNQVGEFTCRAGGSASNVARGLASGFGVSTAVVGACGCDEWGSLWHASMKRSGVSTKHVVNIPGATGRSVVLLAAGERSCRTYLDPQVTFPGSKLSSEELQGAQWLFVSGYAAYQDGLLPRAVQLAKEMGLHVALDLASWEVLGRHWELIQQVLQQGTIDLCFCNQEEAKQLCELLQLQGAASPEAALAFLLRHCRTAVVTLGPKGCIAGSRDLTRQQSRVSRASSSALPEPATTTAGSAATANEANVQCVAGEQQQQMLDTLRGLDLDRAPGIMFMRQPGVAGVKVVDVTGAGDMFAAGFLHGMLRGWSLQRCAEAACLSGAAAVQVLGADVGRAQLHWMHAQLLGPHAAAALAEAAGQVAREQLAAYGLVEKIGRGVVYFGSARVHPGSSLWRQTHELAQQVSLLLGCPTWTGGGPGVMQAATEGAMAAGGVVGGIRIIKEAGTKVLSGHYLQEDSQVMCHHLSTRKSGLIQAGCRANPADTTAFIFLPGGLGTMDELFELLTLMQIKKLPQHQRSHQLCHPQSHQCNQQPQQQEGTAGGTAGVSGTSLATPVVLVDYDGFYQGFITFLKGCEQHHMLKSEELRGVMVASSNNAVLQLLAEYYNVPLPPGLGADAAPATSLLTAGDYQQN